MWPGKTSLFTSLDPASILGSSYHSDWDLADPGVVLAGGGTTVQSVPNKGLGGGAMVLGAGAVLPTWEATGFGGAPSALFPAAGVAHMRATFTVPIAIGSRAFVWSLTQCPLLGGGYGISVFLADAGSTRGLIQYVYNAVNNVVLVAPTAGQAVAPPLAAFDTARHLHEVGNVAGGTNGYGQDALTGNVGAAGQLVTDTALSRMLWTGYGDTSDQRANVRIARTIVASAEPSAAQRAAMRAFFRRTYGLG